MSNVDVKAGILVKDYNCIYIVNPKAGTSSIKSFIITELLNFKGEYSPHKFEFKIISNLEISKANQYFKFTFVRNPWDRIVSCYNDKVTRYYVQKKDSGIFRGFSKYKAMSPGMSFDKFVEAICSIPDEKANKHFKSQHSICNFNNKPLFDFVGKLEDIDEDFNKLCLKLKFPSNTLPHRLKTSDKYKRGKAHYSEFYNKKTIKMIRKRYSEDIELFNYSF
jgi:hypothetical protein